MMQQAQQMTGKLQEVQEGLGRLTVTGTAGGGLVTVEADGRGTVKRVSIDPKVVNPADVDAPLVPGAVDEAEAAAIEAAGRNALNEALVRTRPRHAYVPFSAGPLTCIGQHFSMQELILALATLAARFRLKLHAPEIIPLDADSTLRPGIPIHATPQRR